MPTVAACQASRSCVKEDEEGKEDEEDAVDEEGAGGEETPPRLGLVTTWTASTSRRPRPWQQLTALPTMPLPLTPSAVRLSLPVPVSAAMTASRGSTPRLVSRRLAEEDEEGAEDEEGGVGQGAPPPPPFSI